MPVHRSANASGSPIQAVVRQVAALGSASQLRAWAHDTLDARASRARIESTAIMRPLRVVEPEHELDRASPAVLEFLRDSPLGDGAGFRAWVATTNPFDDGSPGGVEVLTFHGSKGREWHTVMLAGVEIEPGAPQVGEDRRGPRGGGTVALRRDDAGDRSSRRRPRPTARRLRPDAEPVHRRASRPASPSPLPRRRDTVEPAPIRCSRSSTTGARTGPANSTCSRASCAPTATSRRSPAIVRRRPRNWPTSPRSGR